MRKYLKLTVLLLVLFAGNSCEDVLEENPTAFVSPEVFYNSERDAITALTGMYGRLAEFNLYRRTLDMFTTIGNPIVSPNRIVGNPIFNYTYSPTFGNISSMWQDFYKIIGDANKAVGRIEASTDIPADKKDALIGEALFLRAYSYYMLQQLWGGVPLWTDEIINAEDADRVASLPRASVEDVRAQIIADLLIAQNTLPSSYDAPFNKQRATKWAAKSLLAKTYMYTQEWAMAQATAADVINNSPHVLLDDFASIFNEENQFNDEIILTLDFEDESFRTSNNQGWRAAPRARDEDPANVEPYMNGFGLYTLRKSFMDTYAAGDTRFAATAFAENTQGAPLNFIYMRKLIRTETPTAKNDINVILLRLADIYLVHAEAANENGDIAAAEASLNTVRDRAGVSPITGLSQNDLRLAIRQERDWELVGEHQTKLDRMRWGTLVEDVKAQPAKSIAAGEAPGQITMAERQAENISETYLLFPIPEQEFTKNPNLGAQNPGY